MSGALTAQASPRASQRGESTSARTPGAKTTGAKASRGSKPASGRGSNGADKQQRSRGTGGNGPTRLDSSRGQTSVDILKPRLMLIACVVLLLAIGLVMIYSASSVEAYSDYGDPAYFLKRQAIMIVIGLVIMVIVIAIPFSFWNGKALWGIWIATVLLLAATEAFGFIGLGSKRWIYIGSQGFQPSELAKIAMMLLSAYLIVAYHNGTIPKFTDLVVRLAIADVIPAVLILLQPDLGTVIVAAVGVLAVMWFGEVSKKAFVILAIFVAVVAIMAIIFAGFRSDRIQSWLNPWSDPLGSGYQVINSFYAFSDGGLFGVGLGNSAQKYLYLPYAYNDFIFAVIGEEFGLVGATVVIAIFCVFVVASFRIGKLSNDLFSKIVANSCATVIAFQAFLNIACVIGVLPITGKPLPFISYGGSSMISTMIMVGFILAVSWQRSSDTATKRRSKIKVYSKDT